MTWRGYAGGTALWVSSLIAAQYIRDDPAFPWALVYTLPGIAFVLIGVELIRGDFRRRM